MKRSKFWCAPFFLAVTWTTGCGVFLRTRPVEDQYSKAPLKQATQQELTDSINALEDRGLIARRLRASRRR